MRFRLFNLTVTSQMLFKTTVTSYSYLVSGIAELGLVWRCQTGGESGSKHRVHLVWLSRTEGLFRPRFRWSACSLFRRTFVCRITGGVLRVRPQLVRKVQHV